MKKSNWLIVANSSVAHIYRIEKNQHLVEIEVLEHPDSRLDPRDLTSDRPGRTFDSKGAARHAYEPKTNPKKQEFLVFAKKISHFLDAAYANGDFNKIYLAANPNLLGILRQTLSPNTLNLIESELDKDMTHLKPEELLQHLPFIVYSSTS